jgi:putative endonuclease
MTCYVYALRSDVDGACYVGISSHLQRRIKEHNGGHSASTRAKRPWRLIYREECNDHASARKREVFLKSGRGHEWLLSQGDSRSRPA